MTDTHDRDESHVFEDVPAGVWVRGIAFLVDAVVFAPLAVLTSWNQSHWKLLPVQVAGALPYAAYKALLEWRYGQTLGKRLLRVRVVTTSQQRLSLGTALLRNAPVLLVGLVWVCLMIEVQHQPAFADAHTQAELAAVTRNTKWYPLNLACGCVWLGLFLFAAVNQRKRAVYDLWAGTICLCRRRPAAWPVVAPAPTTPQSTAARSDDPAVTRVQRGSNMVICGGQRVLLRADGFCPRCRKPHTELLP